MGGRRRRGTCHGLGLCETQCHCVSTGVHTAEPPGYCPLHVHGALCQRLSRLPSHSPAFSSLALPGLVQTICAKLAQRALAHASQETTRTDVAGDTAVRREPACGLPCSLRFSSCLLTLGVAEGGKLWKGLHQPHGLFLTFSNPDECV